MIMVRLGKPSETADRSLLHLLDVAFSSEIKLSDKLLTMADMYGIPMTEAFGEELNVMCNWGEGIWERAVKETTTKMMEQMNIEIDHKNKEIEQKDREIEQKEKVQAWDMYSDHMPPELIAKYIRRPLEVVCGWLGLNPANI